MSYPVDPSELYELRREVEELKAELDKLARVNATLSEMRKSERCRRKKAERAAKQYADANARAMRIIESFHVGPPVIDFTKGMTTAYMPCNEVTR